MTWLQSMQWYHGTILGLILLVVCLLTILIVFGYFAYKAAGWVMGTFFGLVFGVKKQKE